jgi:hypothetical protein
MHALHDDVLQLIAIAVPMPDMLALSVVSQRMYRLCASDAVWLGKLERRIQRRVNSCHPRDLYIRSLRAGQPRVFHRDKELPFSMRCRRDIARLSVNGDGSRVWIAAVTLEGECYVTSRGACRHETHHTNELFIGQAQDALIYQRCDNVFVVTLLNGAVRVVYMDNDLTTIERDVECPGSVTSLLSLKVAFYGVVVYVMVDRTFGRVVFSHTGAFFQVMQDGVVSCYISLGDQLNWITEEGDIGNCHVPLRSKFVKKYMRLGNSGCFLVDGKDPTLTGQLCITNVRTCFITNYDEILILTLDNRLKYLVSGSVLCENVLWVRDTRTAIYTACIIDV